MTSWIIDASVTINWILKDELDRHYSIAVFQALGNREVRVPSLWLLEVTNVLLTAHRRNRVSLQELRRLLADIEELEFQLEPLRTGSASRLMELAMQYHLTVYDAAYLDLGLRTGFPIATHDKALLAAMQSANVERVAPAIDPAQ